MNPVTESWEHRLAKTTVEPLKHGHVCDKGDVLVNEASSILRCRAGVLNYIHIGKRSGMTEVCVLIAEL